MGFNLVSSGKSASFHGTRYSSLKGERIVRSMLATCGRVNLMSAEVVYQQLFNRYIIRLVYNNELENMRHKKKRRFLSISSLSYVLQSMFSVSLIHKHQYQTKLMLSGKLYCLHSLCTPRTRNYIPLLCLIRMLIKPS